jgi:CBS domain-containing protein
LTPETLVTAAADYMRRAKVHRVLVMAGKQLLGLVSSSDITAAVADGKLTARTYVFDRARPRSREWGRHV